jgi:molybdopterin synthase sulfur carrier subunit
MAVEIKTIVDAVKTMKSVKVRYFALLREERGLADETLDTSAYTLLDLYDELKATHGFALPASQLRVAVRDQFVSFETPLQDQDEIVFVPPVAGG